MKILRRVVATGVLAMGCLSRKPVIRSSTEGELRVNPSLSSGSPG